MNVSLPVVTYDERDYFSADPDRMCECGHPHRDHRQCWACVYGDYSDIGVEMGHGPEPCTKCDCEQSSPLPPLSEA